MKLLALCTGLALLAIATGPWRGEDPPALESRLWVRLLDNTPIEASESLLAAHGKASR